jgi:hypothetical protein
LTPDINIYNYFSNVKEVEVVLSSKNSKKNGFLFKVFAMLNERLLLKKILSRNVDYIYFFNVSGFSVEFSQIIKLARLGTLVYYIEEAALNDLKLDLTVSSLLRSIYFYLITGTALLKYDNNGTKYFKIPLSILNRYAKNITQKYIDSVEAPLQASKSKNNRVLFLGLGINFFNADNVLYFKILKSIFLKYQDRYEFFFKEHPQFTDVITFDYPIVYLEPSVPIDVDLSEYSVIFGLDSIVLARFASLGGAAFSLSKFKALLNPKDSHSISSYLNSNSLNKVKYLMDSDEISSIL